MRMMAWASAASSPMGARSPQMPPSNISRGPLGQSVLTTGQPHAIASTMTLRNLPTGRQHEDGGARHVGEQVRRPSGKRHILGDTEFAGHLS